MAAGGRNLPAVRQQRHTAADDARVLHRRAIAETADGQTAHHEHGGK